jgi:hypothetical protein
MRIHLQFGNVVTLLVGLGLIAMGIYGYFHMGRFLHTAKETQAVVVEVTHESVNKKGRMHPVVRFTTGDGQAIVAHPNEHHNVQPGDTVRLIYDPHNPADVEITTLSRANNRRLLFAGLTIAVGLVVCGFGLGMKLHPPPAL